MTTLSRHGRLTGLAWFTAPWLAFQVLGADPYPRSRSADPSTFGLSNIDPGDGSTSLCGPVGTRFNLEADAGTPPGGQSAQCHRMPGRYSYGRAGAAGGLTTESSISSGSHLPD